MVKINVSKRCDSLPISRAEVARVARSAAPAGWDGGAVDIIFVDDETIAELNRKYFGKDNPTDVIAFPLEDDVPAEGDNTIGEVVISVETASEEAEARRRDVAEELALYIVHGVLHLAGYIDADEKGRRLMYEKEKEAMRRAGYSRDR